MLGLLLLALSVTGCGGGLGLGTVEGTVTLDGRPLHDAQVIFHPVDGGRPSVGRTDVDGHFELTYIEGTPGALPGEHKVIITSYIEADPDSSDSLIQTGRAEDVPSKYNKETTLTSEVTRGGSEVVTFDLTTGS